MNNQIFLISCIFGAVTLVVYAIGAMLFNRDDGKLRDRLAVNSPLRPATPTGRSFLSLLTRLGQTAAKPFMPSTREKQSSLRRSLGLAGIYSPSAVKVMTGCKVIFLGLGIIGGYVMGMAAESLMLGLSLGGVVGYLSPAFWLRMRIKKNRKSLDYALPDALDLMVVCIEAGLTIDSAMQRVGQELVLAHPTLSRELGIAHMETRVGLSRAASLKNLGQRTGSMALQSLSAMLIQADRFGTSIASALRIHADSLRINRQHAAEEVAAKAAVKMSFPLVLFIFPATFIILAGPTVIELMNTSF